MTNLNRLAVLLITVPGVFAIARLGIAVYHPSFAARFVEHLASVLR